MNLSGGPGRQASAKIASLAGAPMTATTTCLRHLERIQQLQQLSIAPHQPANKLINVSNGTFKVVAREISSVVDPRSLKTVAYYTLTTSSVEQQQIS